MAFRNRQPSAAKLREAGVRPNPAACFQVGRFPLLRRAIPVPGARLVRETAATSGWAADSTSWRGPLTPENLPRPIQRCWEGLRHSGGAKAGNQSCPPRSARLALLRASPGIIARFVRIVIQKSVDVKSCPMSVGSVPRGTAWVQREGVQACGEKSAE